MSKKIEKLKEINNMLDNILSRLETQIFIDDVSNIPEFKTKELHQNKVLIELKH